MLLPSGTLGRFLVLTSLMAVPGIVAVVVLAGFSGWRGAPVVMAIFLIVSSAMLVAAIYLRDLSTLARYVRGLGPAAGDRERTPRPVGKDGRWLVGMIAKLQHRWRQHDRAQARRLDDSRSIMEVIGDPLLVLTADRAVAGANGAALRLFGAKIEGRDLANVLRQPEVLTAVDQVLAGGDPKTVAYTSPVPVERVFEAHISPFSSGADAGRGDAADPAVLISLHDITKIKRAEQMRADFVANASHELRTPLSALSGFIETLNGPARDDPDARDRFLAIMGQQTDRMSRLVHDLLSLSHIELDEHTPPQARCDLRHIIGAVIAVLEIKAKDRQMTIVVDGPDDLPDVPGDPDQLTQVFQNLMANAIAYGRTGTELTINLRPASTAGIARGVAVSVRDHGEGIPSEHLPRLTERFYRVDPARSRALGGTGLGLAIVKHIVNRHRGRLTVESEVGEGTTFTVFLPAFPDSRPVAESPPTAGRRTAKTPH